MKKWWWVIVLIICYLVAPTMLYMGLGIISAVAMCAGGVLAAVMMSREIRDINR